MGVLSIDRPQIPFRLAYRVAWLLALLASAGAAFAAGCSSDDSTTRPAGEGGPGFQDPYGAKAAGQARAARLSDESMIVQPAHGRQRIRIGDFILVNDQIAVAIEDLGLSDGFARFGGEILAVDKVGEDGRPLGVSNYGETLIALSNEMVNPTTVKIVNDGSNGKAAVVRAEGTLEAVPFLDGLLGALFYRHFGFEAAIDYVLEPGAEKLDIRLGVKNPGDEPVEFSADNVDQTMHSFFHTSNNQLVSAEAGFARSSGEAAWVGFVSGEWNFAWRAPDGDPLKDLLEKSGLNYFTAPGFIAKPGVFTWSNYAELIAGGPYYDGLREAIRRVDGAPEWRAVTGRVTDAEGLPVENAWVHAVGSAGQYLTRVRTNSAGEYTIHVPPSGVTRLIPQKRGYGLGAQVEVPASSEGLDLSFAATGLIEVTATDADSGGELPVRIQVIALAGLPASAPPEYGVEDEIGSRLHQEFAMQGRATLRVPPGEYRVVVSRGYEWELVDETVTVVSGETRPLAASLEHSVDSTGIMCADFHIHTRFSMDSSDPVRRKVMSAIADGLEIPVSSEHDWVLDFQPTIEELGVTQWAFGMPSNEVTSFEWGHMGVMPLTPRSDQLNNGAIDWPGRLPPELFDAVRERPEDPILIINHPSGGSFANYFDVASFNPETGVGRKPDLWSSNFDAIEVFNASDFDANREDSVTDWFALLNHGHSYWATGSSDSHSIRTSPIGYPRTCAPFGHDDPQKLTQESVKQVFARGVATISGGLLMTVEGPGGEGPGEILSGEVGDVEFTVTVRAPSWVEANTLEVLVDGETQSVLELVPANEPGLGNVYRNRVAVSFDQARQRSWVVFHAKGDGDLKPLHDKRVFAVSNPVFLVP